jgi:preprotein translocase subunit YajC
MTILPFILIFFVIVYFVVLRPQQNQLRRQRALMSAIAPGEHVIAGGGLVGRVVAVEGDRMQLEIADGVVVEFLSLAVSRRLDPSEASVFGSTLALDDGEEYDEDFDADGESDEEAESDEEGEEVESADEESGEGSTEEAVEEADQGADPAATDETASPAPGQDPR